MGFFKSLIQKGVGIAGKTLQGFADAHTGGMASKMLKRATDFTQQHSGIIGKVANKLGKKFLSSETRNKLSNFADNALKYIPGGAVKDTLTKINNTAQGRTELYNTNNNKFKSSNSRIASGEGSIYGQATAPIKVSNSGFKQDIPKQFGHGLRI